MPFLNVILSESLTPARKQALALALTQAVAEGFKHPASWVTVNVECSEGLVMAGSVEPCAMANLQSMGGELSEALNHITAAIHKETNIPQHRVAVNMVSDFSMSSWGFGPRK